MNITFVGTGYVGLVSGVMMSYLGHNVTCIDLDSSKIVRLKKKEPTIYEDSLEKYLKMGVDSNRLHFVDSYDQNLKHSDAVFVTVGTPSLSDGSADLSNIFSCVGSVLKHLKDDCVIVIKSTVPPGTCNNVESFIKQKGYKNKVASNPEFLREGTAIHDFINTDRIIIGGNDELTFGIMKNIYAPLTKKGIQMLETDLSTSELIKYASNSFLANKIAFINELSDLCQEIGCNINHLSEGIGMDKRIGNSFLKPGPGFGGSCFPKDILALQKLAQGVSSKFLILDAIINSNNNRPANLTRKVIGLLGGDVKEKKIAVFGLTYKANTDDLRCSPAINLIKELLSFGAKVVAYDPQGMKNISRYKELIKKVECKTTPQKAARGSDAIIIATEWNEFKVLDYKKIKTLMKTPFIFDFRNVLDKQQIEEMGFEYHCIGSKKMGNKNG